MASISLFHWLALLVAASVPGMLILLVVLAVSRASRNGSDRKHRIPVFSGGGTQAMPIPVTDGVSGSVADNRGMEQ